MTGFSSVQMQSLVGTAVLVVSSAYGLYRALRRALNDSIDNRVHPQLLEVTEALVSHMADESAERKDITKALKKAHRHTVAVKKALEDRTEVLDAHMVHDEETLKLASDALAAGQNKLLGQLASQHAESVQLHKELTATVQQHVDDDADAFARIEDTLKEKP